VKPILEHVNLYVKSPAQTETFLCAALPEFSRRGAGYHPDYGPWIHVGNDDFYISLTEVADAEVPEAFRHAGFVVDDVEVIRARLERAGYLPVDESALNGHPWRRRIYFTDGNGLSWEFVQYLSDDVRQRHDYSH
jgi:catechol 2,3-dioxygenase-like lactoylglutathione lyase family enzyme